MSRLSEFLSQFLLEETFSDVDVWNYRTLYYFGIQQYKGTPSFVSLIVDNETDKKYIKINSEAFSDDDNSFLYHEYNLCSMVLHHHLIMGKKLGIFFVFHL